MTGLNSNWTVERDDASSCDRLLSHLFPMLLSPEARKLLAGRFYWLCLFLDPETWHTFGMGWEFGASSLTREGETALGALEAIHSMASAVPGRHTSPLVLCL